MSLCINFLFLFNCNNYLKQVTMNDHTLGYVTTAIQQFIQLYPSNVNLNIIKTLFARWFNTIPAFNNPDTGYNALSKIFFVTSSYNSILTMHRHLLAQGIKAPYAILYNDTLAEQYNAQFLSNFTGKGFPECIFSTTSLTISYPTANLLQPYSDSSMTNITLENIQIFANISRANYSIEANIFANSYPELFDIQSHLTNLFVLNRPHLYYVVSNLYLPNYMVISSSNNSYTTQLPLLNMNLVAKNYYALSVTIPVYMKLTQIQPSMQPYIDTEQSEYKLQCRFEFDLGVINSCNIYYNLPIKGINIFFSLTNLVYSQTSATIECTSITMYPTSFYPLYSFTFSITGSFTYAYAYMNSYTSPVNNNQFYIYTEKYLSFTYGSYTTSNSTVITSVTILDAVYPNGLFIFTYC